MAQTNEFERDLTNQAQLKHPGRVDMVVFQNIPDAGDGSPGIQRCFRNYLHEGGIEKDLQLLGFSIKGTSVDINNAELQQLSNIGSSVITTSIWTQLSNIGASVITSNEWSQIANIGDSVTINVTQWGYVGGADQPVKQADSPTFSGLTLSANLVTTSTIDSVNISTFKSDYDTHKGSTGIDHSYINQDLKTTFSPTFVGLTLSANVVSTSTFDGVDVSAHTHSGAGQGGTVAFSSLSGDIVYTQLDSIVDTSGVGTASMISVATHVHTDSDGSSKVDHVNLNSIGSNAHSVIDTHLGSTANPHSVTLDKAHNAGNSIADGPVNLNGCNSSANALVVGYGLKLWSDGSPDHSYITNSYYFTNPSIKLPYMSVANTYAMVEIRSYTGDQLKTLEIIGGSSGNQTAWITRIEDGRGGTEKHILSLQFTGDSALGSGDHFIDFWDSAGIVGSINSEVVYTEFTGAHSSQSIEDTTKWEIGMLLASSGNIIGASSIGRSLGGVRLTNKKQDKAVYGVFGGSNSPGHNFKGFDNEKIAVSVNALGEGQILVTDTNGNIDVGDYIQSSSLPGLGEKQDDDILHNYTAAKSTENVNWDVVESIEGIKKKLIACTYHCG